MIAGLRTTPVIAALLFTVVLTVYLQTFGGRFYSIDEELHLRMTRSLVEGQGFAVTPIEYAPEFSVARGLDGQMYFNRNPGLPIVAVPFYLLGKALAGLGSPHADPPPDGMAEPSTYTLALSLANTLLMAGTATLLFLTVVRLGYERPAAAVVALLLAFGTLAWLYAAKSFFAEPLLTCCTLLSFFLALGYRQRGHPGLLVLASLAAGWAIFTKVTALALVPFLVLYVCWPTPGDAWRWSPSLRRAAWVAAGVAPFVLLLMVYNGVRFGSPFLTGYELEGGTKPLLVEQASHALAGLYGLTLSSGKGLLVYATPVVLGLWAAPRFWRAHRAEAVFIYGLGLTTVLGVALWRDWAGGWGWGPRLVLNIVPLLLIPAAALLPPRGVPGRSAWWVVATVGLMSAGVQLVGVLPNYLAWFIQMRADTERVYWSPLHSPLAGNWQALSAGELDLFWHRVALYVPYHVAVTAGLRWAILAIGLAAAGLLWWAMRTAAPVQRRTTWAAPAASASPAEPAASLAQLD